MKLSAKTRYAARILFYMAKHVMNEPISSNLLAAKTGISSQFIEQILRQLRLAGITGSVRGAKGGHILLRKPEELTFGCIVKLMEGGIELAGCWKSGKLFPLRRLRGTQGMGKPPGHARRRTGIHHHGRSVAQQGALFRPVNPAAARSSACLS